MKGKGMKILHLDRLRPMIRLTGMFCLMVGVALGLGACNEHERGRPTSYNKGHYMGKPDTALSPAQLSVLGDRHNAMASGINGGGGSGTKAPSRRSDYISGNRGINETELNARALRQSGGTGN